LMPSVRSVLLSMAGVALALVLARYTAKYQYGILWGLPQLGVFLAAASGGPIWGLMAGVAGGLNFYHLYTGYTWLAVLSLTGLVAGLLSSRMRPVAAAAVSWVTVGLLASYYIYSQNGQPIQAFYAWVMSFSYELVVSAIVVDASLALLHVTRIEKKEKEKEAVKSEAQAEIGL